MDRQQRGGAGSVNNHRRSPQIERVRDTSGKRARKLSGDHRRVIHRIELAVVVVGGTDDRGGSTSTEVPETITGILDSRASELQKQALLRVHVLRFLERNAEKFVVEFVDLLKTCHRIARRSLIETGKGSPLH